LSVAGLVVLPRGRRTSPEHPSAHSQSDHRDVAEQSAVLAERHGEKRANAAWIDSGTVNAIIRRELSRELVLVISAI
jgi:hypothetical protein